MLIEEWLSRLKGKIFLGIVVTDGPDSSTSFIEFTMVIIWCLPKQKSYASFLNSKNFV